MYTILGAGFGLYGYAPALVTRLNKKLVLQIRYKNTMLSRPELANLVESIEWVPDLDNALELADSVIIATSPETQIDMVKRCLGYPSIQRFVLEKPLAPNPKIASEILNQLQSAGKELVVGYTLAHLSWQSQIKWPTNNRNEVALTWHFMAHHFSKNLNNWKRMHSKGGGVLRFFGTHLVAMLAMVGYEKVQTIGLNGGRPDEPEVWLAIFSGVDLPNCTVEINSRSREKFFRIKTKNDQTILSLAEPFELEVPQNNLDRRVPVLARLIKESELKNSKRFGDKFYQTVNDLWLQSET